MSNEKMKNCKIGNDEINYDIKQYWQELKDLNKEVRRK